MNNFITKEQLIQLQASEGFLDYFNENFPDGGKIKDILEQIKKDKKNYSYWLFENFKLSGLCEGFYENGNIRYRWNYVDGKLNGLCEWFYNNGKIESRENYIHGELVD